MISYSCILFLIFNISYLSVPHNTQISLNQNQKKSDKNSEKHAVTPKKVKTFKIRKNFLAGAASVFPGVLLSGSGHYAAEDKQGAKKLFFAELAGLGLAGAGGAVLAVGNSSRKFSYTPYALLFSGAGIVVLSHFADFYGSAINGKGQAVSAPFYSLRSGLFYVDTDIFRYSSFWGTDAQILVDSMEFTGNLKISKNNRKYSLTSVYYWFDGRKKLSEPAGGSFFKTGITGSLQKFDPEEFKIITFDLFASARLDMKYFHPSMRGSFSEMLIGYAVQNYKYDNAESYSDEIEDLLLMRFAYGIYLGNGKGEVSVFYDNRHDTYTGGLRLKVSGDGPPGFIGFNGYFYFTDTIGVFLETAYGKDWSIYGGITYRSFK